MRACSVTSNSLGPHGLWPNRLLCPWDFPRQEYSSGLIFPLPGNLSDPGTKGISPESPALAGRFFFFFPTEPLGSPRYDDCDAMD